MQAYHDTLTAGIETVGTEDKSRKKEKRLCVMGEEHVTGDGSQSYSNHIIHRTWHIIQATGQLSNNSSTSSVCMRKISVRSLRTSGRGLKKI
jgi:hypothetical protein